MQIIGPRTSTLGVVYTADQIWSALTSTIVRERWIWDRLDQAAKYLDDLTPFVETDSSPPVVTYDTTQAVKRSLTMTLRGDAPLYKNGILSLNNQVRGHYQVQLAPGDWVDFIIGTFVVLPAGGDISSAEAHHTLSGTDYAQLLLDYNFSTATSVPGGVSAVAAAASLLSIPGGLTPLTSIIPDVGARLVLPITWDTSTSRLKAINDVLAAVNYFPAWFDESGIMRSSPIPDWNTRKADIVLDTTKAGSIVQTPIALTTDWSTAGNIQTVKVEDPRRPAFARTYVNDNPLSPVSTVNYHEKTLPFFSDSNIIDETTAYLKAKSLAQEAARIFQSWTPDTFAWPLSQDQDVIEVVFKDPDDGIRRLDFVETGWSMSCKAGLKTGHTFSQLVAG